MQPAHSSPEDIRDKKRKEDVIAEARRRWDLAVNAEATYRQEALEDLRFCKGEQWPDDIRNARDTAKRPCLVINKLPGHVRQVTNDQRQNRPAIKVSPVDDMADVETAKHRQGLIRHIEYNSSAEVAYDTAFECAARAGRGYFRICTDYVDPMSFDQEILIKRVRNSMTVYMDPHCQEPDYSDANWGFVFLDMSQEEFKAKFPDAELSRMEDWKSLGDNGNNWISEDSVRVAEYYYKAYRSTTIYQLPDGQVVEEKDLGPLGVEKDKLKSRKTSVPSIKWCKINGLEILEETDWPGRWIPIVPVLGDELDVDGEVTIEGIVRQAKDSQRMYNYNASYEAESIALAPKSPWLIAEGQIGEYADIWNTANQENHAYLPYKEKSFGNNFVPPPQRNSVEPAVQAITNARMLAADDIKSITGIYDASLGNRSNEVSGIAIDARKQQSQVGSFHLVDNMSRSIRHGGRIINDLIPHIYDGARASRIIGEDGEEQIIKINQEFQDENGKTKIYDFSVGKYDITVDSGPSFATKRQEAATSMLEFVRVYPAAAQIIGDLIAGNMDWNGAKEISERLKKLVPPEVLDNEDEQQPIPPEVKQQMTEMGTLIDQLTEQLNQTQDKVESKGLEFEHKERLKLMELQVKILSEIAKAQNIEAIDAFRYQLGLINQRLDLVGIDEEINGDVENVEQPQDFDPAFMQPHGAEPPAQPMEF